MRNGLFGATATLLKASDDVNTEMQHSLDFDDQ